MKEKDIVETVKVYLRKRPFLSVSSSSSSKGKSFRSTVEFDDEENVGNQGNGNGLTGIESISTNHKTCTYFSSQTKLKQEFSADYIFDVDSKQSEVYETVAKPIVTSCLEGYSGVVLAYGPTSSGKTYTMRGNEHDFRGIMPRCIEEILSTHSKIELWASYLQIYCEVISDLLAPPDPLNPSTTNERLVIREKSDGSGVYVEGLSKQRITSLADLWELLLKGDNNRFTAATNANEQSSRSHAILMLSILIPETTEETLPTSEGSVDPMVFKEGKLLLVDLAGSERAKASEGRDYLRAEEAKAINLSLSALGNCMNALAEGRNYIPYRDSKLTRLLTNCLGGSSRTSLIVNLLPDQDLTGETLNALRFASRASRVKVSAKISKYQNYEQLYKDLLMKMKDRNSVNGKENPKSLTENSQDYSSLLQEKQTKIEQQELQIQLLQQQLQSLQQENQLLRETGNYQSTGTMTASSSAASIFLTNLTSATTSSMIGQKQVKDTHITDPSPSVLSLQEQIDRLTQDHLQAMQQQYTLYQRKLQQKDQQLHQSQQHIQELQHQLYQEKEQHYQSITTMKKYHEQLHQQELLFQQRLEDCLTSINQFQNEKDHLQQLLQITQQEKITYQRQLYTQEQQLEQMVNREQVKEMEMLFMETITKLSQRVQALESSRGASSTSPPMGSSTTGQRGGGVGSSLRYNSGGSSLSNGNNNTKNSMMTSEMILASLANPSDNPNSDGTSNILSSHTSNYMVSSDRNIRMEPGKIRPSSLSSNK